MKGLQVQSNSPTVMQLDITMATIQTPVFALTPAQADNLIMKYTSSKGKRSMLLQPQNSTSCMMVPCQTYSPFWSHFANMHTPPIGLKSWLS